MTRRGGTARATLWAMTCRRATTGLALAALLVACGGATDEVAEPTPPTPEPTMSDPSTPDVDPGLQSFVEVAVEDLAGRLGVQAGDIRIVSAEAVSWGDTSLGCPQPGMRYAQVVTDGTQIVLEHDGDRYDYHSGGDRTPFLCEQPSAPTSPTKSPTVDRTLDVE